MAFGEEETLIGCAKYILNVLNRIDSLYPGLEDGRWGLYLAIKECLKYGIIQEEEQITKIIDKISEEIICRYVNLPLRIPIEDRIFAEGICLLKSTSNEETLHRYIVDERLVYLVDECERLLTTEIAGISSPNSLSFEFLHSIAYFLKKCSELKINHVKAK